MREILFFLIFNFSSGYTGIPTLDNLNSQLKKLQWKFDEFEPKIKNLEETNHDLKATNHELKLKVKHSEWKIKNLEEKNEDLEEKVKTLEEINREFVLVEQKKLSEVSHVWLLVIDESL